MEGRSVAVIGCGTAGSAAALFLSRAGHEVTLFERVLEPGPVGAGIMMQPSGLGVLEKLGCAEDVLARGARVDRLVCQNERHALILDLGYETLAAGLFGVGLHRGVLFETLFDAVRDSDVELRCGVSIERVTSPRSKSRTLVDESGRAHGPFDLVVVCDGARSPIRESLASVTKHVTRYPWGALWFIGTDASSQYSGRLHQRVRGTRDMVGMLPSGLGPGGAEEPLMSLFFSVKCDEVERWRDGGVDAWKRHVVSIAPEAEHVLEQIRDMRELTMATYYDVTMPRWHTDGIAFLGDAAHATSPQLGQGCNLALYDAMILAEAVATETSIDSALETYTMRRRAHLGYYQLATRWLTPFFQSDWHVLGRVRDFLMSKTGWLAYAQREMVRSMCGTKTGIFTGTFETRMPARREDD